MQNVADKFGSEILLAISDFESRFEDPVTWGQGLYFLPDVERSTSDNVPLLATVGIYLELPGPTEETVVSGSIFVPPQMEIEQVHKAVYDSLVSLREQRSTAPKSVV